MRKLFLSAALTIILTAGMATATEVPQGQIAPAASPDKASICEQLKAEGATPQQLAQRGCCSWHGGVCGCSVGRIICCDSTLSPSCRC